LNSLCIRAQRPLKFDVFLGWFIEKNMIRTKLIIAIFLSFFICDRLEAQIVLNELSNRNSGQIADEDNSLEDWIELYNPSGSALNLSGYYLSDDSLNSEKWAFPSCLMPSGDHLIVFASGKDRSVPPENFHWESPVLPENTFDYIVPTASTSVSWMKPGFTPTGWSQGKGGFGFGDNDDATIVPTSSMAVYIRKSFLIPVGFRYSDMALQIDYDDGFVVYLNGIEIARKYISGTPTWNSAAAATHEASMYSGGKPETIAIDTTLIKSLLITGKNIFAVEVHNYIPTSTDLSIIPFFSFKINDSYLFFDKTPATIIPSGSKNLHTNFKIDGKGEKIFLFNKNENTRESVWVKDLSAGWSIGRKTDGADTWGIFLQPTPSSANTTKATSSEREPAPMFSVSEGYYTSKQSVSLTTTSLTAEIRYTTDGSDPISTSNLYTGVPLTITVTGIIRAACFSKGDKLPGRPVSNTYFINNTGHSIPVLSVITTNENLFGGSGIFDNWQQEWEKPCYVEYFDANKKKQFEQFSGIQIDGGAGGSRSNPQHSFRLEFDNSLYGDGKVHYPLIPDRPDRKNYKSVYLRNGSNQWQTFQFKDAMECEMMSYNTNNYYSNCTPVVVYINGSYFGVYEMREKLNDEYFQENYKATIDSTFQLLSQSWYYNSVLRALNGSVDAFTTDYNNFLNLNQAETNYLQKADQILDLDYYTDYIIAQSWIADNDWPNNNIKIVKGDFTNHRWRFILQDLEWSLNPNGWTNSTFDHISFMLNYDQRVPFLRFWKELMKNQTYKKQFINRFADIMNSSYLPQNTTAIAQSVYNASYSEMRGEYALWSGESQAATKMSQYVNNLAVFKSELTNRSTIVRANIVSNFGLTGKYTVELQVQPENAGVIQVNTISPEVYPWTGVYFAGVPIRMEAKGMGNYVFDGWVPNGFIKDVNNPVIEADVKISAYKFIAKFRKQTPEQAITISEINYNSGTEFPAGDWIELFNYGETAIDLTGWYLTDIKAEHIWTIPGSPTILPNDRLVLASSSSKFSFVYPAVKNVLGSFEFGLGSPTDSVQLFNASNKLVAGVKYSSQSPWPAEANDKGMTLELKDPNIGLNFAANWFAGCAGGSPGSAYSKCVPTGSSVSPEITSARLYPNPANDQITLVLPTALNELRFTYTIFDVMGKEVQTGILNDSFQRNFELSVASLTDGIYIIHLSGGNYHENLKFIKRNSK
jgi:hypothetical protein